MSDEPRDPQLEHLLDIHAEVVLDGLRTSLPGQIVEYDPDTQRASVQLLIKHAHIDAGEERIVQALPQVHDVPVRFQGGQGTRMTFPIDVGDLVWVTFSSSALKRWLEVGGGPIDPGDDRHHDLTDAVAEPNIHSFNAPPTAAPQDAVVIWVGSHVLKLGSAGASKNVLTTQDGADFLTALAFAIVQLTGAGPPGAPGVLAFTQLYNALTNGGSPPTPSNPHLVWPQGSSKVLADT